jgi:PTH1 family peptidyl-tRNA hydrolase
MKYLISGLGNIGDEYRNTRHNIGFTILDALAQQGKVSFELGRLASIAKMKFKSRTLVLIKPSTYMNLSGKSIKYWLNQEKISVENSLTILDDISLPTGKLRMKMKGGDGNHNGLTSIIEYLQSTEFPRLRVGVGNDFPRGYQSDYVLGKWTKEEEEILIPRIKVATDIVKSFVTIGSGLTMTNFNNK